MEILKKTSSQFILAIISTLAMGGCGENGGYSLQQSTSFSITSKSPAADDIEVDLVKPISIVFSDDVQSSTVNSSNIIVTSGSSTIAGTWSYDSSSKTATFTPTSSYPSGSAVVVKVTAAVLKSDNSALTETQWTFNTVSLSSLIAYWRFDGNGSDYSGHNVTATPTNITYDTTNVKQGSASAKFDGSSFFDVGTLNLGDTFTITVWVYLPDPIANGINTIISNGIGGINQNGFKIFINEYGTSNRCIATEAGDGTNGTLLLTTQNFATLGSWKHLAVVIDKNAATPSDRALFYFNGALTTQTVGTGSTLTSFPSTFGTNQQTYIGKFPGDVFFYQGNMDDFRIYNRVLSASEILQISQQN